MKKHSKVEITWLDSHGVTTMWEFQDDFDEVITPIKTLGYYIKRKDGVLYLAQSLSEQQYGRILKVPSGCIMSITQL